MSNTVKGRLPFEDSSLKVLVLFSRNPFLTAMQLQKIKVGSYIVPTFVPEDVKTLITQMLCVDPKERISIEGIKANPWFKSNQAKSPIQSPDEQVFFICGRI